MAKEHVHALEGLACRKLRLARLPPPASRLRRSRRLRDTLAAAPGLFAHACVTETVNFYPMGPKLRHTGVQASTVAAFLCFSCTQSFKGGQDKLPHRLNEGVRTVERVRVASGKCKLNIGSVVCEACVEQRE